MAKEDFLFLENPMPGQVLRKFSTENPTGKQNSNGDYDRPLPENPTSYLEEADIITSAVDGSDKHKPILDIDFGAQLIPSSTPGHFHLYLDKEISWYKYKKLLLALASAGIIEPGYAQASINRGYSAVRLPWIDKPLPEEDEEDKPAPQPKKTGFEQLDKDLDEMNLPQAPPKPFASGGTLPGNGSGTPATYTITYHTDPPVTQKVYQAATPWVSNLPPSAFAAVAPKHFDKTSPLTAEEFDELLDL